MRSHESKTISLQQAMSCLAAICVLSACSTLPKENAAAKSEYKKEVVNCSELSGVEHSMCIQDANTDMEATVTATYKSALSAAENDYRAAILVCKEKSVDLRNDCLKSAEAAKQAALAKAEKARRATISTEKKPVVE